MKRIFALLLSLALTAGLLAGCGSQENTAATPTPATDKDLSLIHI